jgi:hypothetical protein
MWRSATSPRAMSVGRFMSVRGQECHVWGASEACYVPPRGLLLAGLCVEPWLETEFGKLTDCGGDVNAIARLCPAIPYLAY